MVLYHGSNQEVVGPRVIDALESLKVRKLYNQYVFKSARALEALKFIGSEAVHE